MLNRKKVVVVGIATTILLVLFAGLAYSINHSLQDNKIATTNQRQDSSITKQLQDNNQEIIKITDEKLTEELLELKSKPITVAIFGSDARSTEAARSDVIMLMKYYPMTNDAVLISVPRDARVTIPGTKVDKINHAYAYGGAKLLTQTLEKLFKTKIDYYLEFKFSDFKAIIDTLGGVEVNSDKDYGYNETAVPKGISILTGEQALFYVRFRHDANGDFGRIKRQQEVVASILQKSFQDNPNQSERLLTEIYSNYLKSNLVLPSVLKYHKILDANKPMKLNSYTLKTNGQMIDNIYYGIIDAASLETLQKRLTQ